MSSNFNKLYNDVFDENNNVRPCGRDTCKTLIAFCNNANPDIIENNAEYFGSLETGHMNIENIQKYARKIRNS